VCSSPNVINERRRHIKRLKSLVISICRATKEGGENRLLRISIYAVIDPQHRNVYREKSKITPSQPPKLFPHGPMDWTEALGGVPATASPSSHCMTQLFHFRPAPASALVKSDAP